jgi:DNA-binding beta-propeller fold protein YncE
MRTIARHATVICLTVCFGLLLLARDGSTADTPSSEAGRATAGNAAANYLSPIAVAVGKDGKRVYVLERTAGQVVMFDASNLSALRTHKLPGEGNDLVISADGSRLFVSGGTPPAGYVEVLDAKSLDTVQVLAAGHSPAGLAVTPDGTMLVVCDRFRNEVAIVDVNSMKVLARLHTPREPVAVAVTPDGKTAVVANHLPLGRADAEEVSASVSIIDPGTRQIVAEVRLLNGSTGLRGICVSPDGAYAYTTHTLARYQMPTTMVERGWMNDNAVSVIDLAQRKLRTAFLLDEVDRGAANPWGIACTPDGRHLCVSHAGTHELSLIDREGLHANLAKIGKGAWFDDVLLEQLSDVSCHLSFLRGIRQRIKLPGNGPRGLCISGTTVYIAEYFSDSLAVVDLGQGQRAEVKEFRLGPKTEVSREREGEMLFHDGTLCFQQWQSCSTCHTDGRADGLNWDLISDGLANPKNTRSLVFADRITPCMSLGGRENLRAAVLGHLRELLFAKQPETDAVAIEKYIASLRPVSSPYLVQGELSDSARRGATVFEKAGCAECHFRPSLSDNATHDVGTSTQSDAGKKLKTSTLVECWRTAPYLVDGRAETVQHVFTKHNPQDKHGATSKLSEAEKKDLVQYVLSL